MKNSEDSNSTNNDLLESSQNQSFEKTPTCSDGTYNATTFQQSTPSTQDQYKCEVDGIPMIWNSTINQWLPEIEVNEDFLASYNASYGIQYDYSNLPVSTTKTNQMGSQLVIEKPEKLSKEEREKRKREATDRAKNWLEIDDEKNTNVYVSGLPSDITEEEFMVFS
jgi:hypothetical protein